MSTITILDSPDTIMDNVGQTIPTRTILDNPDTIMDNVGQTIPTRTILDTTDTNMDKVGQSHMTHNAGSNMAPHHLKQIEPEVRVPKRPTHR